MPQKALASFRKLIELEPEHAEDATPGASSSAITASEGSPRRDACLDHAERDLQPGLLLGDVSERAEKPRAIPQLGEGGEHLAALEGASAGIRRTLVYHYLGQEYSRQKRKKEALQAFQRALEIQPELAAAEVAIAEILRSRDR
jgi:tetratricopeptide (TPR) repeat protein